MKAAVALALLCAALMLSSSWDDSPAYDEPEHALAGYCYVRTGEFWMNPFHPPLVKFLSGLGLAAVPNQPPTEAWQRRHKMDAIDTFFRENDPQLLIRAARLPLIAVCALFIPFYFALVRRQFGQPAALTATIMLALSPTWLAHARLVNTDALAAVAAFVCVSLLVERRIVLLGLATGLAQLVKFSLAILLPFYLLVYLVERRNPLKDGLLVLSTSLAIISVTYCVLPVPADYQSWYNQIIFKQRDPLVDFLREHPSPSLWYVTGLYAQTRHLVEGHDKPSYLRKQYYQGGRWDFFPTLMLTKEPTAYLILAALALVWGRKLRSRAAAVHLGFVFVYLGVALAGNLNMGIRHALPVFPSLFAVIGYGLEGRARWLLVWAAGSVLLAWPGYLAYFNELAGGKKHGPMVALDSNFDWGVDLYRLKQRGLPHLTTLYFGRLPVEDYLGDTARPFTTPHELSKGDLLAISANYWVQLQLFMAGKAPPPLDFREDVARWLGSMEVVETVGDTQLIVRVR